MDMADYPYLYIVYLIRFRNRLYRIPRRSSEKLRALKSTFYETDISTAKRFSLMNEEDIFKFFWHQVYTKPQGEISIGWNISL